MTNNHKTSILRYLVIRRRRRYILYGISPPDGYDSIVLHNGAGKIIATSELMFDRLERYFNTLDDGTIEVEQDYDLIHESNFLKGIMLSSKDKKGRLLNALNMYDDCLLNIAYPVDPALKRIVYDLADHLTFDPSITAFLAEKNLDKKELHKAVSQWFDLTAEHIVMYDSNTSIDAFLDIVERIKHMVKSFYPTVADGTHA